MTWRDALGLVARELRRRAGRSALTIVATAECRGRTGVEMEALTAVSAGLLTIYDMCKAVDRGMRIDAIQLLEKRGGASGTWRRGAGRTHPQRKRND